MPLWYIYIVSNNARTLYCGMTANLKRRVRQHKERTYPNGFTARYTFDRLVYFETAQDKSSAAQRERQIKAWRRQKKVALIEKANARWKDLSLSWTEALMIC
jgi:putative endonuclease